MFVRSRLSLLTLSSAMVSFCFLASTASAQSTGKFSTVGSMSTARETHTATLLANGKVLIAGGLVHTVGYESTSSAELYDPATGTFAPVADMTSARESHDATLLPNGKVLISGGIQRALNGTITYLDSAEVFDPATGTFTSVGSMSAARQLHTVTVLGNGKVLIAGGDASSNSGTSNTAELFDPATATFSSLGLGTMSEARSNHTATLLPNGKVLLAAGDHEEGPFYIGTNTAELFDPASGTFTPLANTLSAVRYYHTATLLPNGKVLISGGFGGGVNGNISQTAELFDPATGTFAAITAPMTSARGFHTATLLPNGKVLLAGGQNDLSSYAAINNTAELFDPATQLFTQLPPMSSARIGHSATLLCDGRVLIAGGYSGMANLNSAELFDSSAPAFTSLSNTMTIERGRPTTTLLPNGKVLIAGGESNTDYLATAEYFDAASNTFTPVPNAMNTKHMYQTATSLPNGKVLMAGGITGLFQTVPTDTAELFDPDSETFTSVAPMTTHRIEHTATLLANGKVLIAGGTMGNDYSNTAELFDPNTNTSTLLSHTMTIKRFGHSATLLPNGKVLIAGGITLPYIVQNTAELFDPVTQTFAPVSPMSSAHYAHSATLLQNGKVLIAGGYDGTDYVATADLFDPATNTFTALPAMNFARYQHTATLLPNGKVLLVGGSGHTGTGPNNSAELFDPVLNTFVSPMTMNTLRANPGTVLLPSGKILVAGGYTGQTFGNTNSAEVFDMGLGFSDTRRPIISDPVDPVNMPASLVLHGTGFRGDSQASADSPQSSATNYPIVQLMRIDGDQTFFVLSDPLTNWSDTTFTSAVLGTASNRIPVGRYRVTVFTNGIPSLQKVIDLEGVAVPEVPLVSVVSRKAHGNVVTFDVPLPVIGSPGIECRSGGANGFHTIIFTFANELSSVDQVDVTSGVGNVDSKWINSDMHQYVVNLTGVANAQTITVSLSKVADSIGNFSPVVVGQMAVLLGDVNASGNVDSADVGQVQRQNNKPLTTSNFRMDVNVSGNIDAADVGVAQRQNSKHLP